MNKRFISVLLVFVLVLALVPGVYAEGEEEAAPKEYKYPVPEGLPDVDVASWEFRLANSYNSVSRYMAPRVAAAYGVGIDARVYEPMISFVSAAQSAGYPVYVSCGYLSAESTYIVGHYQEKIKLEYGDAYHACLNMLPPGCNEHQTGLGFDVITVPSGDFDDAKTVDYSDTETFAWMKEHCAEYGFIVRYPAGKEDYYGVACCPTHFRYVGIDAATYIMDNDLCLEEFLLLYGVPVTLGTAVRDAGDEKYNLHPENFSGAF